LVVGAAAAALVVGSATATAAVVGVGALAPSDGNEPTIASATDARRGYRSIKHRAD
jgi:hypothetical protein